MKQVVQWFSKGSIRNALALVITFGAFFLLYLMMLRPIPAENKDPINLALGFVLGGGLSGVIGYYFGSSKNESDIRKEDASK